MKILTIIPTKLDSTRLKEKNILLLEGKPLFHHSIDYARASSHQVDIIVSTESTKVKSLIPKGVQIHNRDGNLCGDVEVVDVYLDIIENIDETYDYVVCLQPDNPNRSNKLDDCLNYMIENNYDDLITVNNEYKRSGSVRIFKYEYLKAGLVSKRMGCIRDDAMDIHYQRDLDRLKVKEIIMGSPFGKKTFREVYQKRVGWNAGERLHENSRELLSILIEHTDLNEGSKIFELGSGGARNLHYIHQHFGMTDIHCSDLWEEATKREMTEAMRKYTTFYEGDSEDIINYQVMTDLDLFLTSDHLMHLQHEKTDYIIKKIMSDWRPKYMMMRELKKGYEQSQPQKLFHNYAQFLKEYDLISDTTSKTGESYFIWLLRRKK